MKCPHCNREHPDDYQFCPITGQKIEPQFKACTNESCPDYGKYILPLDAKFCPRCGKPIQEVRKGSSQENSRDSNANHSQIVVICSKAGSFIQIGRCQYKYNEEGELQRDKRIKLRKGKNVICVEEYSELQYGFSFDTCSDNPEYIINIILDEFDTSHIDNMCSMFEGCRSLETLDLSSFDTSNVIDMAFMFSGCSSLKSLDLSDFDTSNVTDMNSMFEDCSSLESLDLSGFDTSNVTDMNSMFEDCSSLESLELGGFDTSNARTNGMFIGCSEEIQEKYEYLL